MRLRWAARVLLCLVTPAPAVAAVAGTPAVLPVTVDRVDEKIVVVRSGEQYFDAVIALASERGLVVIDAGIAPSFTRTYRAKIEETFKRKDFAYVINTHSHFDHITGNQVFPEAIGIASERARERMVEWSRNRAAFVQGQRARVEGWKRQAEAAERTAEQRARFSDLATLYGRAADDLEVDFTFVPPVITFPDRMSLHLGDMTVLLYAYGPGTHVGDDIVVHVPEIGLIAVGDLSGPGYVQVLDRREPGVDIDHKLAVLDTVLADEAASRHVVNGHGARMTRAELVARRDYLAALNRSAKAEIAAGGTLAGLRARLPLDGELAFLKGLGIPERQLAFEHRAATAAVWTVVKGLDDAAEAVGRILREQGVEAARAEFARILPLRDERYFIDENAFNRLGYALLGEQRAQDAVVVLEMNARAFPESWNVHDSLGEALAAAGDRERAIASYERSVQLNPDNANGVAALERLRGR